MAPASHYKPGEVNNSDPILATRLRSYERYTIYRFGTSPTKGILHNICNIPVGKLVDQLRVLTRYVFPSVILSYIRYTTYRFGSNPT
jgi:hypothetical protein